MEIKIKRTDTQTTDEDKSASDTTHTYRVLDNGREFTITLRSHRHGSQLGIAGQKGFLYTDTESGTVHMQVVSVGRSCGITIDSDEPVEGLSPWSIRGVVLANQRKETREITITTDIPGSSPDKPMVLIDGEITDTGESLR